MLIWKLTILRQFYLPFVLTTHFNTIYLNVNIVVTAVFHVEVFVFTYRNSVRTQNEDVSESFEMRC